MEGAQLEVVARVTFFLGGGFGGETVRFDARGRGVSFSPLPLTPSNTTRHATGGQTMNQSHPPLHQNTNTTACDDGSTYSACATVARYSSSSRNRRSYVRIRSTLHCVFHLVVWIVGVSLVGLVGWGWATVGPPPPLALAYASPFLPAAAGGAPPRRRGARPCRSTPSAPARGPPGPAPCFKLG